MGWTILRLWSRLAVLPPHTGQAYPARVDFVLAMMAGAAVHLHGATVPGAEILVALSVIALGVLMLGDRQLRGGRRARIVRDCRCPSMAMRSAN